MNLTVVFQMLGVGKTSLISLLTRLAKGKKQ